MITVAIRVVNGRRLGSAADAGKLCTTKRAKNGVQASSYRRMREYAGAPWPWRDPATATPEEPRGYPSRNPEDGTEEYDLDEVQRWHDQRKGPGQWLLDVERRTPRRLELLEQISEGRVRSHVETVTGRGMQVTLMIDGKPIRDRVTTRMVGDFDRHKLITTGDPFALTEDGAKVLARWKAPDEASEQQEHAQVG